MHPECFAECHHNSVYDKFKYSEIFNICQTVFFNWIIYNDNNLIRYDKWNLLERFTNPTIRVNPGKSFVRGNIKTLIIPSTYIPGIKVN